MKLQIIAVSLLMLVAVSCSRNYQVKVIAKNKNTGAPFINTTCGVHDTQHSSGVPVVSGTTDGNGEALLSFDIRPSHHIVVWANGCGNEWNWEGEAPKVIEFKCQ